ncbi:MAG: glutathione S-transferase N-terminal domain-containing protein [Gammaproteobacteria bacterium]|nr:glutathione S-transferase N-terminal domain-containing protein [Gammaproteobacteria bacterium]
MPIFKLIRAVSKPLVLIAEKLFNPPPIIREPMVQQGIDRETANMAIYEYRACPFCMKTRRALRRLSLRIELRDALKNAEHKKDLLEQGGKIQVPCLRISSEDGEDTWMYESSDIIQFLEDKYGATP